MTVSSTGDRVSYAGNGSTTVFSFPYYFLTDADLTVLLVVDATGVETTKVISTDYSVSGAGESAGGSVTMVVAPASGETLTLLREVDATQETDFVENDALPAESLEQALDKLTMLAQQAISAAARAINVPRSDSTSLSTELPAAATRASKYFGFNSSGEPVALDAPTVDDTSLVVIASSAPAHVTGRIWVDTGTAGWHIWSQSDGTSWVELFRLHLSSALLARYLSDAGAGAGPDLLLDRSSASPAAADLLGRIMFRGRDSGAAEEDYADIVGVILDPTAASEDGAVTVRTRAAGAGPTERLRVALGLNVGGTTDPGSGKINVNTSYKQGDKELTAVEYALTDAATIAWDMSNGPAATVTLGGNRTLGAPTNAIAGQSYALRVVQDGTGTRTLAYNAAFKWPSATAPVVAAGAADISLLTFYYTGSVFLGGSALDFG
jgi:hypothetical protein